jgi:hypothetical protein
MMVEVEANLSFICQLQSSLLYVTQLLTAMQSHAITCDVAEIACDCMRCHRDCMQSNAMLLRSHAIACDVMQSQKRTFLS